MDLGRKKEQVVKNIKGSSLTHYYIFWGFVQDQQVQPCCGDLASHALGYYFVFNSGAGIWIVTISLLNIVTWSKATWLNGPLIWSSVSVMMFNYKQRKDFQRKAHKIGIACVPNTYGEEKQTTQWCVLTMLPSACNTGNIIFAFETFSCFPYCLRLTVSII